MLISELATHRIAALMVLFVLLGQITGSGTVPNMVQVSRIRYVQSHNASGKSKVFQFGIQFLTAKIQRNVSFGCMFLPEYHFAHQKSQYIIWNNAYSIHKVILRRLIN